MHKEDVSNCQSRDEPPSGLDIELFAGLSCQFGWNMVCLGLLDAIEGAADESDDPVAARKAG
jgi:hypothetical protein